MNKHQLTTTSLIMLIQVFGVIFILIFCFCCMITKYRNRRRRNEVQMTMVTEELITSSKDHASKQANLTVNFSKAMDSVSLPIEMTERTNEENTEQAITLHHGK